ncbi:MAG: hypothetical protein AAFR18_04925 [Cyanobacteria bacterium J06627_32]
MNRIIQFLLTARGLSAISLLSLVLAIAPIRLPLQQTGTVITLATGGAAIATLFRQRQLRATQRTHQLELDKQQTNYQQRETALKTFSDIAMAEVETFKAQLARMEAVLEDDQVEKFSVFEAFDTLTVEHQHLLHELFETAIIETTLKQQLIQLQRKSQEQIEAIKSQTQVRITELEAALGQKTNLATQMLTELEAEATDTFNQFNAKVKSQGELINNLYQQIDALKKANASLTQKQLDKQISSLGANNFSSTPSQIRKPLAT